MRFPNDRAIVVDDGNAAMWVHCPEFGRVEAAEPTAGFDVPMFNAQLADQPHDFLEVERAPPSPDCQHVKRSPVRFSGSFVH
jgi:hypothetical protein